MRKTDEAVKYMIDVWDEVMGKSWREKPDHVQQKFLDAEKELLTGGVKVGVEPILIKAGDTRLLINGMPPFVDCRLVAEEYYQNMLFLTTPK